MPRRRLGILASLLLVLAPQSARALDPNRAISQYVHASWTAKDGLPINSLSQMAQTPDGYLWIGTMEGLVRYDGFTFKTFDRSNTPGLPQSEVRTLLVDSTGTLWIGLAGGGLVRFKDDKFEPVGLAGQSVGCIYELPATREILLGATVGTYRLSKEMKLAPMREPLDLSRDGSNSFLIDGRGRLWIAAKECVFIIDGAGRVERHDSLAGVSIGGALAFREDRIHRVWVATLAGLFCFRDGRFERWGAESGLTENAGGGQLLADRDGNIWAGQGPERGIVRISGEAISRLSEKDGLKGNYVNGLFEDREGNVWVATWDGGLNRFSDAAFTTWSTQEGLSHPIVRSVFEDSLGRIWVGTMRGGVNLWTGRGWRAFRQKDGLASDWVDTFAEGLDGEIYTGGRTGISVFRGGRFEVVVKSEDDPIYRAMVVHIDRQGRLWAQMPDLACIPGKCAPTLPISAYAIIEDRRGHVWIGDMDGVLEYSSEQGFKRHKVGFRAPRELVFAALEDSRGELWFGSLDGGLARYRDGKFKVFSTQDGLYNESINCLVEDDERNLWIGSTKGITRIPLKAFDDFEAKRIPRLTYDLFTTEDGLKSNEVSAGCQPTAWKGKDGRLWFATADGVSVIDPKRLKESARIESVVIERAVIDSVPFARPTKIEIPPGRHRLEIEYTGMCLRYPSRLRFRYRLEGLDAGWVDAAARRRAEYPTVPHGSYKFRVAATADGRVWRESTPIAIAALPHFWQTRLFYGSVALAAAAIIIGGIWLRERSRMNRERVLTRLVDARTRELTAEQERSARVMAEREEAKRELEAKQELDRLVEFSRSVAGLLDPDEIAARLVKAVHARWGEDVWCLVAAVREGRAMLFRHGGPAPALAPDRDALRQELIRLGRPAERGDAASVEWMATWTHGQAEAALGCREASIVPMAVGETPFGLLAIGPRAGKAPYTERDLAHAEGLAAQCALALEGAWQAQEALRWQSVSEARREWSDLDLVSRLAFAAVSRHGFEQAPSEELIVDAVEEVLKGTGSGRRERIRATLARMIGDRILSRDVAGGLRVERERWLLLPEIALPLAEIAKQTAGRIGAYQLLDRIGIGGMGEVLRGVNVHDGSPAAIKLLYAHETTDPEARKRLDREGKIVASISHPNIVRLLERGEHDGRLYLAMELLHGDTLARRISNDGRLSTADVVSGGRQLASALAELHRNGVIHRDVNSSNVMCEEGGRLVLLDLGLAKPLQSTTLTRTHSVLGTLPYMSPEQLRGEELDERTDIWSLGVVLYEMLTGELPWDGPTTVRIAMSILNETEPPSSRVTSRTPPSFASLIAAMIEPQRDRRIRSVEEVGKRIESLAWE